MKSTFLSLAIIAAVLCTSMVVSTASFSVASAVSSGWHTQKLNISVTEDALYKSTLVKETKSYEINKLELTVHTDPNISLTMTVKFPTNSNSLSKVELLSFTFQQGNLSFTGWKGTVASLDSNETTVTIGSFVEDFKGLDIYDIYGSGKGSYGSNSRFDNAVVEGSIHIDDFYIKKTNDTWIDWVHLTLQATIRYFAP